MNIQQIRQALSEVKASQRRTYEIGVVVIPDEQIASSVVEKIKDIITSNGGAVISQSELGRRTLAYPIRKNRKKYLEGIYKFVTFEGTKSTFDNLDKLVRIDENVLRHIIIRVKDAQRQKDGK